MNNHELLSKAAVIREYGFPEHQLDADLRAGKISHFTASGEPVTFPSVNTRYFIPRAAIERRIRELARMEDAG